MRNGILGLVVLIAACAHEPTTMIPPDTFRAVGLEWQRNWPGDWVLSRARAKLYCESLFLEGKAWRLPTKDELLAVWNVRTVAPRIGHSRYFWSSTPGDGETGVPYLVPMGTGGMAVGIIDAFADLDRQRFVRCVR